MEKLKYLLVTGLLVLGACATQTNISQPRVIEKSISDQISSAVAYSDECLSKYDNNPDFLLTYQEIYLKGENPPNKNLLLSSNKKLNAKQKKAFQNYTKLTDECTQGLMSRVKGAPFFNLFESTDALLGVNESNLLDEKITIGEANNKKLEISRSFSNSLSTLLKQPQK
ncbi:hypothetical protein G6719_06685 [Polynucleobacter paneuropaeus]|nr:hypothetical protein G6719_06685 [Polynucleobacter paneuropaeus]